MHIPPTELNTNYYWKGLSPFDLMALVGGTTGSYYIFSMFEAQVLSAVFGILGASFLYQIRRTKRKKFIRDSLFRIFIREGKIEFSNKDIEKD